MLIAVQLCLAWSPPQEDSRLDPPDPRLLALAGRDDRVRFLVYFFILSYTAVTKFKKKLELFKMEEEEKRWAIQVGRIGLIGRGLLIIMVGGFLVDAAFRYNPEKAGGLGDILSEVARQPYGAWMLGGVALGLVAYGMYSLILVRYAATSPEHPNPS
jgi:hypothetical protein